MLDFRLNITVSQRQALQQKLKTAQTLGQIRVVKFILAILAVGHYQEVSQAAQVLQLSESQVETYIHNFLCYGVSGVGFKKSTGRPARLSKEQKQELSRLIDSGPEECGFDAGCWRSPMIQELILERFGVYYSVFYIAELLKNLGFSFQKARFVSDHLDQIKRREWKEKTWSEILRLAREQKALLLFGDEASFAQWGSLTYTWARRGKQPTVKTSGKRRSYKVFGLIDYFTGRFFYKATCERLTSANYEAFLRQVLEETTGQIVLIQDGARYHTSCAMKEFFEANKKRLTVFQLPSYSPDMNPIEKLWKKVKQKETHLHYFPTFESLIEKVDSALLKFTNRSQEILSLFGIAA